MAKSSGGVTMEPAKVASAVATGQAKIDRRVLEAQMALEALLNADAARNAAQEQLRTAEHLLVSRQDSFDQLVDEVNKIDSAILNEAISDAARTPRSRLYLVDLLKERGVAVAIDPELLADPDEEAE